jgi:hypothetical protein
LAIYPNSPATADDALLFLAHPAAGKSKIPDRGSQIPTRRRLGILAAPGSPLLGRFTGEHSEKAPWTLALCPLTHANAVALRETLPWLRPQPLGLRTSAGCGDRLGLATPGHVRAVAAVGNIAPIFAQQSIREMARTGRSPADVMDDATWGIFQEGWRAGIGADADHLKTLADVDRCVAAGFTLYTIDPGDHVDSAADTDDEPTIRAKYQALPWPDLATTATGLQTAYVGKEIELEDRTLAFDEETLLRAAVKYGRAVAHVAQMYRHLVTSPHPPTPFPSPARRGEGGQGVGVRFELEISVDETETPTSHAEHLFIARELRRLGVRWVSLAPRYVGRFEKGVDYIGDLTAFERDFAGHAAIARALGPYKLSLHSGSDKFSIYSIAAQHARGLVHLKTAGTSYLEALRVTAGFDPVLLREILAFAIEHYEADRASYHVSAQLARVPRPETVADADLPGLLDQFDARQVLHVTYGSVLTSGRGFKQRLLAGLAAHEEEHYAALERHFVRHLKPLLISQ